MKSILNIVASLAATAQGILTFIALLNLKGIVFITSLLATSFLRMRTDSGCRIIFVCEDI